MSSMVAPQHHLGEEFQTPFIFLFLYSEHMAPILKVGSWLENGC